MTLTLEPDTQVKGGLVQIHMVWDAVTGANSETTVKTYNGYFLGVQYVPGTANAATDLTISAHGADLLGGGGTNAGATTKYIPAAVDIAGTASISSIGIPFHDQLTIATASGDAEDLGVMDIWIRLAGEG